MDDLKLQDVAVVYGNKTALAIEQATFQSGHIYGIIGPSGAGKSTLLRVLNLLEKPRSGKLSFCGNNVDLALLSSVKGLALQREMAFVAQKPVMFHTSVYNNVAMGLRFRQVNKITIRQRVREALQMVDLGESAEQQATTLSGGEAQRIALARAIVLQPRLLLLDEPTANLDPFNVSIFEQVIKSVHQQYGTTIIIVTHNLPQAKRLTDFSLFLHKGKIVEWNRTERFFTAPSHPLLNQFLSGQMIY